MYTFKRFQLQVLIKIPWEVYTSLRYFLMIEGWQRKFTCFEEEHL